MRLDGRKASTLGLAASYGKNKIAFFKTVLFEQTTGSINGREIDECSKAPNPL
jgi:hypothetical protein